MRCRRRTSMHCSLSSFRFGSSVTRPSIRLSRNSGGLEMRVAVVLVLLVLFAFSLPKPQASASDTSSVRPVHTFSIVARDPATGELGVAVQSHWFSVGSIVAWAEAGVGAVATQSFVDPSYGKNGLDLM